MAEADDMRVALLACRSVLAKLQVLSDGTTSTPYEKRALVKPPKGRESAAPPMAGGLFHQYLARMKEAQARGSVEDLLLLAGAAGREYLEHTNRRHAKHDEYNDAAVNRLLVEMRGKSDIEAAVWMAPHGPHRGELRATLRWVRRQRVLNSRDPDLGEPREQDARTARVVALTKAGASRRAVAEAVGMSHVAVHRILTGEL
jgi:hypothetical protein